jgi:hypothetical protein
MLLPLLPAFPPLVSPPLPLDMPPLAPLPTVLAPVTDVALGPAPSVVDDEPAPPPLA